MVCAHMRITLRPTETASFICRTMCSRPGSGRCRNGAGASLAASSTSHWFHPAKMNGFPFSSKVLPDGDTRTNWSVGRHVVAVTWSSIGRLGSRALCAPPVSCVLNQPSLWSRSARVGTAAAGETAERTERTAARGRTSVRVERAALVGRRRGISGAKKDDGKQPVEARRGVEGDDR